MYSIFACLLILLGIAVYDWVNSHREWPLCLPDSDYIIIPGMANLSFNTELTSTADAKRTLVSNIGRAIIKKLAVKFEKNEILSIDDFEIFVCYRDL